MGDLKIFNKDLYALAFRTPPRQPCITTNLRVYHK